MKVITLIIMILAVIYYTTGFFNNIKFFKQNFINKKKGKKKSR